jgi:hypothetical protein
MNEWGQIQNKAALAANYALLLESIDIGPMLIFDNFKLRKPQSFNTSGIKSIL